MTLLRRVRSWLIAGAVLGVVVLGLWVSGGLEPEQEYLGRPMAAGEHLTGRRWDLVIQAAHIDRDRGDEPQIVVELIGTFDGEETAVAPDGIVVVQLADGTRLTELTWRSAPGFGQPGVTAPAEFRVDVPGLPAGDQAIEIGVLDEMRYSSFISGERWGPAMPIGRVPLSAQDAL